jgi:hypothetical protein
MGRKKMSKPVMEDYVKHEMPEMKKEEKKEEKKMATGGKVEKAKKPRSEKQIAATKKMLEALKAKKAGKK